MVAALLYRVCNAPWDVQLTQWLAIPGPISVGDLPGRDQRFEDFFDEKGIALGQSVDGIQKRRLHRTPEIEDGSQHCAGFAASEAGERYLLPEVFTVELGQPVRERWTNLVTAIGQQDQERLSSTTPRHILEQFQAGIVTPMHILDDEQQGLLCCLTQEEVRQGGEEAAFLLFGVERWQRGEDGQIGEQVYDIGEQGSQLTSVGSHKRLDLCGGGGEEDRAQEIEQGSVGEGTVRRVAIALQRLKSLSERLGFYLSHQA